MRDALPRSAAAAGCGCDRLWEAPPHQERNGAAYQRVGGRRPRQRLQLRRAGRGRGGRGESDSPLSSRSNGSGSVQTSLSCPPPLHRTPLTSTCCGIPTTAPPPRAPTTRHRGFHEASSRSGGTPRKTCPPPSTPGVPPRTPPTSRTTSMT